MAIKSHRQTELRDQCVLLRFYDNPVQIKYKKSLDIYKQYPFIWVQIHIYKYMNHISYKYIYENIYKPVAKKKKNSL